MTTELNVVVFLRTSQTVETLLRLFKVYLPKQSAPDLTSRDPENNNRALLSVPGQSQINI